MIRASHNKLFELAYKLHVNRILRSSFGKFILINDYPGYDNTKGLILTPNHFSWWDGFFADYVMRRHTKRIPYIMMLEEQLKKYWFFRKVGAFSIEPGVSGSVRESIDYAKEIVSDRSNYLIFYPQGEIQSYPATNTILKKGIRYVVNEEDVVAVISFKILYSNERLPYVCCRFGESISGDKVIREFADYRKSFIENIETLDQYVINGNERDLFKE